MTQDIGAVVRLNREVRAACLPYLPILHTPEEDYWFFENRVYPQSEVWVSGAAAINGFCAFREGWLDHLYVRPQFQGRGIGSTLLSRAMEGQSCLKLWTFQKNVSAIRFYRARGFRQIDETDGCHNEEHEPDVLFEWTRAAPQPTVADR